MSLSILDPKRSEGLREHGIKPIWARIITLGGAVGCAVKYPYLAFRKVMYKIGEDKEMEGY